MKYQKKDNRAPKRSCYTAVEVLRLARNRISCSASGLPNDCSTRGTTVIN